MIQKKKGGKERALAGSTPCQSRLIGMALSSYIAQSHGGRELTLPSPGESSTGGNIISGNCLHPMLSFTVSLEKRNGSFYR